MDFARLQKGDKFKLIYEEAQVEGVSVGIKQINAIYFEHSSSPYYAFPFDQGEGIDYFDDEGKSLRKALLDRSDAVATTATEKLLTYAIGRRVEYADMPAVRGIVRAAARDDYRFASLIVGIVKSAPFQLKRYDGGTEP